MTENKTESNITMICDMAHNNITIEQQEFEDVKDKVKKNEVCCIVGFAASWKDAPYTDQKKVGIDFWGINELYIYLQENKILTPFSAWFEIHNIKESPSKQGKAHQEFLKNCKIPLITQKHWDEYPSSMPYPRKYVKAYYNSMFRTDYDGVGFSDYSNQISWMIALAICLGYKRIMVYGVDMASNSEYAFQRASCQFFLGWAAGKGIELNIPSTCQLLKAGCDYGFESDNKNRFTAKANIKQHTDNQLKLRNRKCEIEFIKATLDRELNELEIAVKAEKEIIYEMLNKAKESLAIGKEIKYFIDTMPDDIELIKKKKDAMLNKANIKIKQADENIKGFESDIKALDKKLKVKKRDVFASKLVLDEEDKMHEQETLIMEGMKNAYNHMLNNNLL